MLSFGDPIDLKISKLVDALVHESIHSFLFTFEEVVGEFVPRSNELAEIEWFSAPCATGYAVFFPQTLQFKLARLVVRPVMNVFYAASSHAQKRSQSRVEDTLNHVLSAWIYPMWIFHEQQNPVF